MIFVGYGIVLLGMLITGTCSQRGLRALVRTRVTTWLSTPVSVFDGPSRSVAASVSAQPQRGRSPVAFAPSGQHHDEIPGPAAREIGEGGGGEGLCRRRADCHRGTPLRRY